MIYNQIATPNWIACATCKHWWSGEGCEEDIKVEYNSKFDVILCISYEREEEN